MGSGVGRLRQRQDRGQVQHGQVPAGCAGRRHLHRQQRGRWRPHVNSYARVWRDLDGDRVVDCDLVIPAVAPGTGGLPANGEVRRSRAPHGEQRPPIRAESRRPRRSRPGHRSRHDLLRTIDEPSMAQASATTATTTSPPVARAFSRAGTSASTNGSGHSACSTRSCRGCPVK